MSVLTRDTLHRTVKLFMDNGAAATHDEAVALARMLTLQVDVGPFVNESPTSQAALLTIVNTAARAFLGGVHVRTATDPAMTTCWAKGSLHESVAYYGGTIVEDLDQQTPTIAVAHPVDPVGSVIIIPTWNGWCGGVVVDAARRLPEAVEFTPSGVLAGGMAVSEAFQHVAGSVVAGGREAGLSLWRPDQPWRDADALGPVVEILPRTWWLLGLGHLGQAYAWVAGLLPYEDREAVTFYL